jgi:ABC transporter, phosphonate, periplasmic substrate-binding protein
MEHGTFRTNEGKRTDTDTYFCSAYAQVVHRVTTRGQTADLDVYGGVIAVRHDRDDISSLKDLEGKIIAASEIVDLMGGQTQIYEMIIAGMSYVNDPKQFVFTGNQDDIVLGLISGRFDVGFIRTGQIESTKDANGNFVDPDLFKILNPQIYILEDGSLFPFLHSTDVFPEWPVAALPGVPADIQGAVQDALLEFGTFMEIGQTIETACRSNQREAWCDFTDVHDVFPAAPCTATSELVLMTAEAHARSRIAGFRTALSYFDLRTMQEAAGFLIQDAKDEWYCTRPSSLFEGVTCPEGFFKVSLTWLC